MRGNSADHFCPSDQPPLSKVSIHSGTTDHFINDFKRFVPGTLKRMGGKVRLGDGKEVKIMQHGQAFIKNSELKNALYVPSFSLSLVSVSKLALQRISATFNANSCHIYNTTTKETIVNAVSTNGSYYIDDAPSSFAAVTTKQPSLRYTLPKKSDTIAIWHRRGFLRWISESSLVRLWTAFTDYHIFSISVVPSLNGKRKMPGFSILTHELRSCPYDGLQLRSLRYRYFQDFRALLVAVTQPGWLVPINEACG